MDKVTPHGDAELAVEPDHQMKSSVPRTRRDWAHRYATDLGWYVVVAHEFAGGKCSCGRSDCPSPAKHPRTRNGFKDATNDPKQIDDWFAKSPTANIGIRTGAESKIVVIDIDPGHDGVDGLKEIEERLGPLTPTLTATSGGGGKHYYFKHLWGVTKLLPHSACSQA